MTIIENGSVLIQQGVITDVGPSRRIDNLAASRRARVIEAGGKVVLPGLIDSHIGLTSGPPRYGPSGQEPDPQYFRQVPVGTLEKEARRLTEICARHGTTSFGALCGFGIDDTSDLKSLRALAAATRFAVSIVRTYLGAAAAECQCALSSRLPHLLDAVVPVLGRSFLADSIDITAFASTLLACEGRQCLERIRDAGLQIRFRSRPECDLASVHTALQLKVRRLDAVQSIAEEACDELCRHALLLVLLPAGPRAQNAGKAVRRLVDGGCPIALATGFDHQTVKTCSMPFVLGLACSQLGLSPAEAITASTINSAHALGHAARVGSLEHGKDADLLILDTSDYRDIVYYPGVNLVSTVVRRGEVLAKSEA